MPIRGKTFRACPLVGSGPRVHRHRRPRPEVWSSSTPRAPDARRGQSWHRRLSRSAERTKATAASNLDTLLGRGNDREVRMLLSFQRPSHLFKKGFPSQGRIQEPSGSRSGPVSIAPKSRAVEASQFRRAATDPALLSRLAQTGGTPVRAAVFLGEHLHRDDAAARPVVEVDQDDLLPGAQRQLPSDHRDRL